MTVEEIAKILCEHFKGLQIEVVPGAKNAVSGIQTGDPAVIIPAEKIREICNTLKVMDQFAFDCLSSLTAVDRKDRFEVVYHLFSYKNRHSLTLKVNLPRGGNQPQRGVEGEAPSGLAGGGGDASPSIETVESLWGVANWLEREVYDLFGIKFDNHSDLRRIMLPDDWVGHPLRKDYKEEVDYHGISTTRPALLQ